MSLARASRSRDARPVWASTLAVLLALRAAAPGLVAGQQTIAPEVLERIGDWLARLP